MPSNGSLRPCSVRPPKRRGPKSPPCASTMRRSSTTCGAVPNGSTRSSGSSASWSRLPGARAMRPATRSCGTTALSPTASWSRRRSSPNTSTTPGFRTAGSTCAAASSPSSATRMPALISRPRRRGSGRRWPAARRRSSWGRASSAERPTARRRRSAARARTTRPPWWPISSMPSRCRCGRMWTAF